MDDNTKKMLMAAGVGVGATAAVAKAMYFLGGREAPHVPSLGEVTGLAKREIGFGAVSIDRVQELKNSAEELRGELHAWRSETGLYEDDDDPYYLQLVDGLTRVKKELKAREALAELERQHGPSAVSAIKNFLG